MAGTASDDAAVCGQLASWLMAHGLGENSVGPDGKVLNGIGALAMPELYSGYCELMSRLISPLWRGTFGIEVLNPELSGSQLVWRDGALTKTEAARAGINTREDYIKSPVYVVDTTNRPFRWRQPEPVPDMELIQRFQEFGMTDYFVMPLPIQDAHRGAYMSFASTRAGGFSERDLALLQMAARVWTPYAERWVLRHIALDLLAHYLGRGPAERVYAGQIERGDVSRIEAAILICDLRNFTAMTDNAQHGEIVTLLNRWFEAIGGAIGAHRGDILKFMGDGLLAVFPLEDGRGATCDRALDAALAALAETDALNRTLAEEGRPPLAFGVGLHWGEVEFGNIGTRDRLDFTVIGPAVNLASRLQDLTKVVGTPVLASADFAAAGSRTLRALGGQRVRGLETEVQVFAPQ